MSTIRTSSLSPAWMLPAILAVLTMTPLSAETPAASGPGAPPALDLNADGDIDAVDRLETRSAWDAPHAGTARDGASAQDRGRDDDAGAWWEDTDGDGLLGASRQTPRTCTEPATDGRALEFELVWDSGATLDNVRCVAAGDADGNGWFDLAGGHFNPNRIHLFEADGTGGYAESWNSGGTSPAGFYTDIAFGDTDGDGQGEIWGSTYSTLGKVLLYEHDGATFTFLHDQIAEPDLTGNRRIKRIFIADTDQDDRQEVIVVTGGSNPTAGVVAIWEHSGAVGENTYTRIHEYTTVSYVYQAAVGDTDNDGRPEIVLGLGGYPLIIRRLEYDPGAGTWLHWSFTSTLLGLPLSPHVGDLDGDGHNELVYGSSDAIGSMVAVFENDGPNSFAVRFSDHPPFDGNGVSTAAHAVGDPPSPAFAAGFHGGDLGLWVYDSAGDTFALQWQALGLGGAIYNLAFDDDGEDGRQEILPAVNGRDQILVYRRLETPSSVTPPAIAAGTPSLRVAPNPARSGALLQWAGPRAPRAVAAGTGAADDAGSGHVWITDLQGRLIRRLTLVKGETWWDGADDLGRPVAPGAYYALLPAMPHHRPAARIVLR